MSTDPADTHREATLRGSVLWYSAEKGYGFILTDDRREVFVRYDGIESDGFRDLAKGERVVFVVEADEDGSAEARHVRREI